MMDSMAICKRSYIWNMVATSLNASQSFIYMWIVTRILGVEKAGFFSFAFTLANQLLLIGKFGVRSFQVTDSKRIYSFHTYLYARFVTTICMLAGAVICSVFFYYQNKYSAIEITEIFLLSFLKAIDAIDDVYQGLHQQNMRLDVGAYWLSVRTACILTVFVVGLYISQSVFVTLMVANFVSAVVLALFIAITYKKYPYALHIKERMQFKKLLLDVIPLFISGFLLFYLDNTGKYAIAQGAEEKMQGIYGFISLPILTINLLNVFFYQPVMVQMAENFNNKRYKEFVNQILHQIKILIVISVMVIIVGVIAGIPFFSWIYGVDLHPYTREFMILLCSGGISFLASGLFYNILIMMRKAKWILCTYTVLSVSAVFVSKYFVKHWGIMGAVVLQLGVMLVMSLVFSMIIIKCLRLNIIEGDGNEKSR